MWHQGEHLALIGRTGTGKTTVLESLLNRRKYSLMFRTKSDTLAWRKFKTIRTAAQMDRAKTDSDGSLRLLLQPAPDQRATEFRAAILKAYRQGGWTVGFDELWEMQLLKLEPEIIQLYSEGRSEEVTCIGGMQRPSWVTRKGVNRWALSQPTHIFSFQVEDDDLETERKILGRPFANQVHQLKAHEFVYRHQATGQMSRGTVADLERIL